jgi:outer membrane protein assembly factor BamB
MKTFRANWFGLVALSVLVNAPVAGAAAGDWPAWRGPTRDGHAAAGQTVPVTWSETENVVWKAAVRGKGHGSPTVVGNRIYLATADAATQEQLVLAFDRATGKQMWETVIHRGPLETGGHKHASQASSSVVWDGERLLVNFFNANAVHTTALTADGKIAWQTRVADFVMHQGFGSSPVVHEGVALVTADSRGGGRLAGLDRKTGKILWEQTRPMIANYASPAVITAAGRTQVVLAGCNLVASFDPLTGKKLWEFEGSTEETVVTAATDGQRIFASGGYPKNHVLAMEADGSGKIAWQHSARVYVPSMIVKDGYVYAVQDAGTAVCWKSDTGAEQWRGKLDKDYYASPVMVGEHVYITSLAGVTSVFEATPQRFKLVAQNRLGDEALATPAICGGRIYLRHAKKGEARQEFLWCVGENKR